MRYLMVTMLLIGLIAVPASAQMSFSLKGGVNMTELEYTEADVPDADQYIRFAGGLTLGMPMSETVGLDLDLLYVMKGAKNPLDGTFGFTEMETQLDYLVVSPMLRLSPWADGTGLYFLGGAEFGYLLEAEAIATKMGEPMAQDAKDYLKEYDFGVSFGLGFETVSAGGTGFFLEGRYALGLTDIGDTEETEDTPSYSAKTRGIYGMAGVHF